MSYDITIEDKFGQEIGNVNVTYNLAPMFAMAFEDKKGIKILDEMSTDDALPVVIKAYRDIYFNRDLYEPLNPENGWGSVDVAEKALKDIIDSILITLIGFIRIS